MEFEFDKEIDSLLRQAAREGEFAFSNPQSAIQTPQLIHLDADEISAFAENALPQKARLNAMEHLAECMRCRKILADVISFNAEASSEIIHAIVEPKTIIALPKIPWYRQLFAFPNLAYTMGAMALLLCGVLGYVVFQSVSQSSNSSVAQMDKSVQDRPQGAKGASSEGDSSSATYSNSNASAANTSAPAPSISTSTNSANTATNSPGVYATPMPPTSTASNSVATGPNFADGNGSGLAEKSKPDAPKDLKTEEPVTSTDSAKKEAKPELKSDADEVTKSGNTSADGQDRGRASKQTELSQNTPAPVPPPATRQQNSIQYPDSTNIQNRSNTGGAAREESERRDDQPKNKTMPKKSAPERDKYEDSKSVSGKTFRSVNGIWTDTAYTGGSTKNVKRTSDDYKKLDSGLRSIADNLGGTVIIVWSGKNYKIQ